MSVGEDADGDDRAHLAQFAVRLRRAMGSRGVKEVATSAKVKLPTFNRWLAGGNAPDPFALQRVAEVLNVRMDELITGIGPESGDELTRLSEAGYAALRDLALDDGGGSPGEVVDELAFKEEWLEDRSRDTGRLAIWRVEGDSMEPDMRPGDLLMIDKAQTQPRDGLYVVSIDGQLSAKRIQVEGPGRLRLTSTNPAYGPVSVGVNDKGFAIIGKGVWIGRNI